MTATSAVLESAAGVAEAPRPLTISVVICTYSADRWDDLGSAVASIESQTLAPDELILVIDHNPRLADRVRLRFAAARVVENEAECGLSGARNAGSSAARGELLAFLDDDAVAAPDWLEQLVAAYRPGILGVGGAADPAWPSARPRWFPAEFDWVVGCTYRGLPEVAAPVRNMIGAGMSLRRDVLRGVGGFEAGIGRVGKLPVGCEETDLCIRAGARFEDGSFLFEPRARVSHVVRPDRATPRYFAARCFAEGRSKALVARRSGQTRGLSSERAYSLRILPRGVARGVADVMLRRDPFGAARALAIVAGLSITTAGYLVGLGRGRGR